MVDNLQSDVNVTALLNARTDNDFGETALHVATERGFTDVVELLLQRGADPNVPDAFGRSARDVAAAFGAVLADVDEVLRAAGGKPGKFISAKYKDQASSTRNDAPGWQC